MSAPEADSPENLRDPHVLLRVIAKFLIPLIAIFGFYVHFHGDYGAGGGFQAGVILSASIILYALIFGLNECKRAFPPWLIRVGMSLGVLLYGGTGVVAWLLGGEFLNYSVLLPDAIAGQHWGIIAIELGVLTTVASVMLAIFYAFGSRQPDIENDDW